MERACSSLSDGAVRRVAAADRLDTLPEGVPELTLGWEALAWCARYLRHPDGAREGERWQFTPRQARFVLWWYAVDEKGNWLFGHGARRLSKGPIAHSELVFTPSGFRRHGDLRIGDEVFAVDGSITEVIDLGEEVVDDTYRVTFRDGTSVVCTGSHRWPVDVFVGRGSRRREILTVKEMLDEGLVFERAMTKGRTKCSTPGVARFRSLPTPCVEGRERVLPIDPYLFGYWLGDGDSDQFRITVGEEDLDSFLAEAAVHGFRSPTIRKQGGNAFRVNFAGSGLTGQLRKLGVLNNKGIPSEYLSASYEQRLALLQGIVDSDGHVNKQGRVEISMMRMELRDDIVALCRSLGLAPRCTVNDATLRGRVVGQRFRVAFSPCGEQVCRLERKRERAVREYSHKVPFSRSRTIVSIEPVAEEPARCITVAHPSHQYLVGEGMVPTCNSGKSPWAAVMALVELLAPVRFDRFVEGVPGGCVGRPVSMPLVQVAAASASQTANTMSYVRALVASSPALLAEYDLDVGKEKIYSKPAGELTIITSSAHSAEGARATCVIADELEHWLPSNGGTALHSTLKANLTKTGSRMIETLNSWIPDVGSAGEATFKAWCDIEDGRARDVDRGILYDAVQAPPGIDLADEESLRGALEFVYADCPWSLEHLDAIISDIYTSPDASAARRKYLNQNVASDHSWVDPQAWAACADLERVVSPEEEVVLFFDGSLSRDATALVGCCVEDGHVFTLGVWEPGNEHGRGSGRVNPEVVDARVEFAFEKYNVVAFFADVREWEGFVHHVWPERYRDRLKVWAAPRGDLPAPIAWDMRGKVKEFTLAAELAESEILEGRFTHDGHPDLANHVRNARRYETRWGISVSKESKNSSQKIDACVAMIGARHVCRLVRESSVSSMTYDAFFL